MESKRKRLISAKLTKRVRTASPISYDKNRNLPPLPSLEVYVNPNERYGLPSPMRDASETPTFTRAATKLVRAHTRRVAREARHQTQHASRPSRRAGPRTPSSSTYDRDLESLPVIDDRSRLRRRSDDEETIDERTGLQHHSRHNESEMAGTGMLSALLTLYGNTAAQSEYGSDASSDEEDADHGHSPNAAKRVRIHGRSGSEATLTNDYSRVDRSSSVSGSTTAHEDEKSGYHKESLDKTRLRKKATRKAKEIFVSASPHFLFIRSS